MAPVVAPVLLPPSEGKFASLIIDANAKKCALKNRADNGTKAVLPFLVEKDRDTY